MNHDFELLSLQSPVGKGQENNPDDIEAIDARLRRINAYSPPPEYADNPQRYATEPMIGALERYQERNGLKIDGVANPGGPTERAINNHLLEKPRGAGLLYDPPSPLAGTVGNGFENRPKDVAGVQRRLGALDYLPEDPFDRPRGYIDEATTNGVKAFQRANGLIEDGWLAPRGETERALDDAVSDLARAHGREWLAYGERADRAQQALATTHGGSHENQTARKGESDDEDGIILIKSGNVSTTFGPAPAAGARAPQPGGPLQRRGFIGVDPRFMLPPRPQRWSDPGDLRWANPGQRPSAPQSPPPRRAFPFGVPSPDDEAPSITDLPRALGLPPHPSLDEEVKRALSIPQRRNEPHVYIPEPGSPLRIPIIDFNPDGRPGDPRTQQSTKDLAKAIKEECEKALAGTGAKFDVNLEKYYSPHKPLPGQRHGGSYADGLVRITIGGISIDVVADTYTPNVDAKPNAGEQNRFVKLQRNMSEYHGIVVRLPKPWTLGQELNKERLSEATRELCEQIKNMLDKGELDPDKKKISIEKLLDHLVKPKPKRGPGAGKPLESR